MAYKWCVVPQCRSTSKKTPHKLFVSVPTKPKKRKVWLRLARRDPNSIVSHSNVFMCEDHFDMEKDTINYMKYKMGFSQKILLADHTVPTKFHCQEDGKRQSRKKNARSSRKVLLKREYVTCDSTIGEVTVKIEPIEPVILRMLEVCVDSLKSALNAIHGGADELELCSSLTEGGLTPSIGLVKEVMSVVNRIQSRKPLYKTCVESCSCFNLVQKPKVNVMIRCRTGSDFCYSEPEMDTMIADIEAFKTLDVDRFVFGGLTNTQDVDQGICSQVVNLAYPKPVTFHRAFDVCRDPIAAIVDVIDLGFDRVLTSGQSNSAADEKGLKVIKTLVRKYGDKIDIMPGAGINMDNAKAFVEMGCKIVHSSCKTKMYIPNLQNKLSMGTNDSEHIYVTDESIVKMTKNVLND